MDGPYAMTCPTRGQKRDGMALCSGNFPFKSRHRSRKSTGHPSHKMTLSLSKLSLRVLHRIRSRVHYDDISSRCDFLFNFPTDHNCHKPALQRIRRHVHITCEYYYRRSRKSRKSPIQSKSRPAERRRTKMNGNESESQEREPRGR